MALQHQPASWILSLTIILAVAATTAVAQDTNFLEESFRSPEYEVALKKLASGTLPFKLNPKSMDIEVIDQNEAYNRLSNLGKKVKQLLKSGQTQEASQIILAELPSVSNTWLSPEIISLLTNSATQLQKSIAKDPMLLPILIKQIEALEEAPETKAAMLDIVGASDKARAAYAAISVDDEEISFAIGLHQIRLLRAKDFDQLPSLLKFAPDSQQTEHVLAAALGRAKTFELKIKFMNNLSKYLEQVKLPTQSNLRWIPRLEWVFNSRVYGEHQMPPLWQPNAGHSNSIIGIPSDAKMNNTRLEAYKRLCKATLRHPSQAAWGFSRLSALADMRSEFDSNADLIASAKAALKTSQEPTPLGSFGGNLNGPRFYTPELYLARTLWKDGTRIPELPKKISARIELLAVLLAAERGEFQMKSQALIKDSSLIETYYLNYQLIEENQLAIAARRMQEVMKISLERNVGAEETLEMTLSLVTSEAGIEASSLAQFGEMFLDTLNAIAKEEGADRIDEILERLAMAYLGSPEERSNVRERLPAKNVTVCWAQVPPAVQYVELLNKMTTKPSLTFSAIKKAEALDILDRINLYRWLPNDDFKNNPKNIIERLDRSPMLGELVDFRCYPRETGLDFHQTYPPSPTLLDWVVAELTKLDTATKKPFLDYLAQKKSFGSKLVFALLNNDSSPALAKVLKAHLDEIKALPDSQKKELAVFVNPKLPESFEELRVTLAEALTDANDERLEMFKVAFLKNPASSSWLMETRLIDLFSQLCQDDPDKALEALRLTVDLHQEAIPEKPWEREKYLSRSSSVASELFKNLLIKRTTDDGKKIAEFYLRALADNRIQSSLIVDERLLNPRFSSGNTVQEKLNRFKDALEWIAQIYPDQLAEEYLFIATLERYGWVSHRGQAATRTSQFHNEVLAVFSPEKQAIVASALTLGANSRDWVFYSSKTPKWTNPQIAAAFNEVRLRIKNEALPMNLRLALASIVCKKCWIYTPPGLVNDCAKLLAEAWAQDALVSNTQAEAILKVFSYFKTNEKRAAIARRLVVSWQNRVARLEQILETELTQHDQTFRWIFGLAATLDDKAFDTFKEENGKKLNASSAKGSLPLLVKAGMIEEAVAILGYSKSKILQHIRSDRDILFDKNLAEHLPRFIEQIESPEDQILAEVFLNNRPSDPFDPSLQSRAERFTALAERVSQTPFSGLKAKSTIYQSLAQEKATAPLLAEGLLEVAELDRLPEIVKTSEVYAWNNFATVLIHTILAAEKFDLALETLRNIEQQSKAHPRPYRNIWHSFSQGISDAVSTHRDNPEALAAMLPLTNYIATLPPEYGLSIRDRAGNYARNIFCHALLDRMDAWKEWRNSLEPSVQKELDELWYSHNSWIIGLANTRTPQNTSLEHRLALMKRILSQKEIVGTRGTLYKKSIQQLQKTGFFSTADLRQIGAELVKEIPDGGNAKKALEGVLHGSLPSNPANGHE